MSTLLNHNQSKTTFKNTGVTWRFKVLYERHLDLQAEEKLLGENPDAESVHSYKYSRASMYNSKKYTPSLNRYHERMSIHNNSSSTLSHNGEFSFGSNSSVTTSIGAGSRSTAQHSTSTHNVTVLIPKNHAYHKPGIEEEIMPSA